MGVHAWNMDSSQDQQVLCGDRIIEVNGVRGNPQDLLPKLREETYLRMLIKRPVTVHVSGDTSESPVGLVVIYVPDGSSLLIQNVKPGFVKDWNKANRGVAVGAHDRIIEVNGTKGAAVDMMALLQRQGTLDLTIWCYNELPCNS